VAFDAYRTARISGNVQAANEIDADYPELDLKDYFKAIRNKKYGSVVLLHFRREIPIKRQSRSNDMLPEFYTRTFSKAYITVKDSSGTDLGTTSEVLDL